MEEEEEKYDNLQFAEQPVEYTDDNIRHLDDMEHIRVRSGMYIGRLGDGSQSDDGIYVLLKEVMDNSIDEFKMGAGKKIEVTIEDNLRVSVRDYGRGIPQGKLIEAVSKLNTGGKYDSKAFKKSVGLNGVGIKAVNALSSRFEVCSYREGKVRKAVFERGVLLSDTTEESQEETGTYIFFEPDNTLFVNYSFQNQFVETLLRNYTYLNTGLTFIYNGQRIVSRHGLEDLLKDNMTSRRILLFRQRTTHHTRRYTPKCLEGTHCSYYQRILQQESGLCRHTKWTRSCHCNRRRRAHVRKPDQD